MIITAAEFATFRPDISAGWEKEQKKIERCIQEAESVDLYDALGPFYFDVVENTEAPSYEDLLDGSLFTYNGEPYRHIGLKAYLAGLAYVRFLTMANAVHTPHGYVTKLNNNSEPVDPATMRDVRKEVQRVNEIEFGRIKKYLSANASTFPKYHQGGKGVQSETYSLKAWTLR